jgi:hypothetical protein
MPRTSYDNEVTEINGILLAPLRTHPRVVEIKLVLLHETMCMNWGAAKGTELMKTFADFFRIEWSKINAILTQAHVIKGARGKKRRYFKQEVVFSASVYNEPKWYIATHYLNVSPAYYYRRNNYYRLEKFVTDEWIRNLDSGVMVCGIEGLRLEAIKFLENFAQFMEVFGNVSVSASSIRGYGATVQLRRN